jgi:hypothetical protein
MDANLFLLPLAEWNALEKTLDAEFNEWLVEWNNVDATLPPMDDLLRGHRRYGHYLGWIAARRQLRSATVPS